ncbi:MAG: GNAT family N-acetyltransferase [Actinomycetota bacterium]
MRIRPMRASDVAAAERLTGRADGPSSHSAAAGRTPEQRERCTARLRYLLEVDGGGCWVADDGGSVVGVAAAARRDLLWVLSAYAVDPEYQGRGAGKALLEAAVGYGAGCLRGMICATPDPRAARRYRLAGFTLHPTMRLTGVVDREALPIVDGVREGADGDLPLVDSVDRQVRGAAHRPDHLILRTDGPLLVCDLLTGSGYSYLDRTGVGLLAATRRAVAQRLLWAALARSSPGTDVVVRGLTSDQEWALDVGLAAGLRVEHDSYLALRHMRPPAPYIPSVAFG